MSVQTAVPLRVQMASLYVSNDNASFTGTGGPQGFSPDTGEFGGIVSSSGLDNEAFADAVLGVDAGDTLIFVIAVDNRGVTPIRHLTLRNILPPGLVQGDTGPDVWAADGSGAALAFTGSLFDPAGLVLTAPLPAYDPDSGRNVVLVAFTVFVSDTAAIPQTIGSVADVLSYTTSTGRTVQPGLFASTTIVTATPDLSLIPETDTPLALDDTVTFNLTITLPEGAYRDLGITSLLPPGLRFLGAAVTHVGAQIHTASAITADATGAFHLGDVLNAPDDVLDGEDQLMIAITARAIGPVSNQPVEATLSWTGQTATALADITVLAPELHLDVTAPAALQPGGTGRITLRLTNTGTAPAYGLSLLTGLPPGLERVPGTLIGDPLQQAVLAPGASLSASFLARLLPTAGASVVIAPTGRGSAVPGGPAILTATATVPLRTSVPTLVIEQPVAAPIGGVTTVHVVGTIPDGDSPAVTLRITLSNSLRIRPASVHVTSALPTPGMTQSGTDVTLAFAPVLGAAGLSVTVDLEADIVASGPATVHADLATGLTTAAADQALAVMNTAPSLLGIPVRTIGSGDTAVQPFATARAMDPDIDQAERLTIQLSDATHGRLDGVGMPETAGTYRIAGTTDAITAALAGLRFVPTLRAAPGTSTSTTVTLTLTDDAGGTAQASSELAIQTPNAPPAIAGAWANQQTTTRIALSPFSNLSFTDADPNQLTTLTIQLQDPARGRLTTLGTGSYDAAAGTFRATGQLNALQAMARALVFAPTAGPAITARFTVTLDDQAGGIAADTQTSIGVSPSIDTYGIAEHFAPSPTATFLTASGGGQALARGEVYGGPVDYLRSQFIYDGDQSIVIVANAPDVFIKSFSGYAAIQLASGQNVVDAGPGSNFLIGGTGQDTFFLDGTSGRVVWDTILGFHPGDMVTMFGFHPNQSRYVWQASDGTAGYTGPTIHADLGGTGAVTASLTFAGATAADTAHYVIGTGRIGTIDYLSVQYPA